MNNSSYIRSAKAQAVLELSPPLLRDTLIADKAFRQEYGFTAEANLSFGESGISFPRSELFGAIRKILSDDTELTVKDNEYREWVLRVDSKSDDLPRLIISFEKQRLLLPDFSSLSPDASIRLRSFEQAALDVNLPDQARDHWDSILTGRPLDDEEVAECHGDIHDSPTQVMKKIACEIREGKSSLSTLVPSSSRYYERLVGAYDESASIGEYAESGAKVFISKLLEWDQYKGLLFGLSLSSHSALTSAILTQDIEAEVLIRVFDFLEKQGDRLSQLGAIEIGIQIFPNKPELEPYIVSLVKQIRDDDVENVLQGIKLFSALFILVDGELSRLRLMADAPPFYRRLASLSQAALIQRELVTSGVNEEFYQWAMNNRGEQFYWQSNADMRLEPRWNPDLASALQMKADFFGRIMNVASNCSENIKDSELHKLILGDGSDSLQSLSQFPMPYFPGPLEGGIDNPNPLPAEFLDAIEEQLNADVITPDNFIALVNCSMLYRVQSNQVELAEKALETGNYRLEMVENKPQLLAILYGLAKVAASCRSNVLSDKLRILVRRYRHDPQYRLSIEEVLGICIVASASYEDLDKWRDFLGEWVCELAFGDFVGNEAETLYSHLHCLLHSVPELWVSCAKADAALKAYIDR
ncbi:MAG: hypothetical protein N0C84_14875 [Candidatus Thiodiazotropha taylori]|uniref:GreAB-C-like domain-containing protein n=1 Tax=Candidatus Thiodiazotropha taylori TaxID=2792791 RepID=A0A9E4KDM3_9GAMM|nr:hypothetical protein [Candidatus Thiodiazotropha taylori]MCW4257744.1 hypothetical protein [Candidatus Thiodiazotropha taylori]